MRDRKFVFLHLLSIILFAIIILPSCTPTRTTSLEYNQLNASSFDEIRKKAAKGDSESLYALGYMYYEGLGVTQDFRMVGVLMKRAAQKNVIKAQFFLGKQFIAGTGVEKDLQEGLKWLTIAAENGNIGAQTYLAYLYSRKEEIIDFEEAAKWASMAAEKGSGDAQFLLSQMYKFGIGVPKSDLHATNWMKTAYDWCLERAKQGEGPYQMAIGLMYYYGEIGEVDNIKAAKWLSLACQHESIAQGECKKILGELCSKDSKSCEEAARITKMKPANRSIIEITGDNLVTISGNVVFDPKTNLMWASSNSPNDLDWFEAHTFCLNFQAGGYTDWRLPSADELRTLDHNYKILPDDQNPGQLIKVHSRVWTSRSIRLYTFQGGRSLGVSPTTTFNVRALPVRDTNFD